MKKLFSFIPLKDVVQKFRDWIKRIDRNGDDDVFGQLFAIW
jgi:hypothetical protein